jgi:TRAP-type C4-dicarboxylate transport system permease small subunit
MAGLLLVLLLAALGMPLFAVIAVIALLGFHAAGYDLIAVAVEYYRLGDKPGLIAIPIWIPQLSFAVGALVLFIAVLDEFVVLVRGGKPAYQAAEEARAASKDFSESL